MLHPNEGTVVSTTQAYGQILQGLMRNKAIGKYIVPIIPDEARTFGMESFFSSFGIYSSKGQLYEPVDKLLPDGSTSLMFYKEATDGQVLEEGINEAGAMGSFVAAGTAYANLGVQMIPFYIYYSMFGFQRVGDLIWLAADSRCKGFLVGGTSGRTTLNGEGLQHEDGHSQVVASTVPTIVAYDPAYAYELAVIIQDGLRRMYHEGENKFYYITTMNENYVQPDMPQGAEEGIIRGMYRRRLSDASHGLRVQLLGGGAILREVEAAAQMLERDYGVAADVWSLTSVNELQRDGKAAQRWNLLHPTEKPRVPYVTQLLRDAVGPVIAATDYIKLYADQIREFVPGRYTVLGTDGFGRSDTRRQLRGFFEVSREYIVVAALKALADEGHLQPERVAQAITALGVDPDKPNPLAV
jgi:pyruvate dehydrogenase E1 component